MGVQKKPSPQNLYIYGWIIVEQGHRCSSKIKVLQGNSKVSSDARFFWREVWSPKI